MSVRQAGEGRLVGAALRCYPAPWRRRHAAEAAELASLLIADGVPAVSIAWSYLAGAARAWLAPRPGRSLSTAAAALLAATCLLGFSAALIAQTAPARAASRTQSPSSSILPTTKPASRGVARYSPRPFTPCRPAVPGQVTGAIPAVGHRQPSIPGTTHARSC
jgi:hypothetical protein